MAYLPYDVFTHILDELDRVKDITTLRSLSTCCSDLRPLAQRKIFHSIDLKRCISGREHLKPILRLHALVEGSPRIADYVRSFEFCSLPEHFMLGASATITRVGKILAKLHHITSLVWLVVGDALDWVSFCAHDAHRDLSQAILSVLPQLIFLKITGINRFPLDVITSRDALFDVTEDRYLNISLAVVPGKNGNGNGADKSFPYPRIRNYRIGRIAWPRKFEDSRIEGVQCLHSVIPPFPPFDFAQLQNLHVTWQDGLQNVMDTMKIMDCALVLKELTCTVAPSSNFTGVSRLVQDHKSRSLTTLNLKMTGPIGLHPSQSHRFVTLWLELSLLGGRNNLERLSIAMELPEYTSERHQADLQSVDATITRETFPSLQEVDILIHIVTMANVSGTRLFSNREFYSMEELVTYLGDVYGGYFVGLRSMEGLVFSCKVTVER